MYCSIFSCSVTFRVLLDSSLTSPTSYLTLEDISRCVSSSVTEIIKTWQQNQNYCRLKLRNITAARTRQMSCDYKKSIKVWSVRLSAAQSGVGVQHSTPLTTLAVISCSAVAALTPHAHLYLMVLSSWVQGKVTANYKKGQLSLWHDHDWYFNCRHWLTAAASRRRRRLLLLWFLFYFNWWSDVRHWPQTFLSNHINQPSAQTYATVRCTASCLESWTCYCRITQHWAVHFSGPSHPSHPAWQ